MNCALLMLLAIIHPMPVPVPYGSDLLCAAMIDPWLAYMFASSRWMLGILYDGLATGHSFLG